MYVEISPRQSGKTTRLVEAATQYLQNNHESTIKIVAHNRIAAQEIRNKVREKLVELRTIDAIIGHANVPEDLIRRQVDSQYGPRINVGSSMKLNLGRRPPDYYFVDEFSFIPTDGLWDGVQNGFITNAYYCTTPYNGYNHSTNMVVDYCRNNNITVNFHNPWTERRLEEQNALGPYMRDAVLGDWVDYMSSNGFPIFGLKENWIPKFIKRHRFNGNQRF